jgi:hypothetical protein
MVVSSQVKEFHPTVAANDKSICCLFSIAPMVVTGRPQVLKLNQAALYFS